MDRVANNLLQRIPADVQLAMYECPLPYHRLLGDQAIRWTAESKRFMFLKDTCCNIDTIRRRLDLLAGSPLQLFNANAETLTASLRPGADGFCGIGANFMPELYAWLCANYDREPELADELQRFLNTTFQATEDATYPASAKSFLQRRGLAIGAYSRKVPSGITTEINAALDDLLAQNEAWLARLNA
ncbi:MAG: dihydrodipicolinate synthase family protein [Pirellulales bacterium]